MGRGYRCVNCGISLQWDNNPEPLRYRKYRNVHAEMLLHVHARVLSHCNHYPSDCLVRTRKTIELLLDKNMYYIVLRCYFGARIVYELGCPDFDCGLFFAFHLSRCRYAEKTWCGPTSTSFGTGVISKLSQVYLIGLDSRCFG